MIQGVQKRFPGLLFRRTSDVDAHNDRVRFAWALGPEGAAALAGGVDFGVIAGDRLQTITGFLDFAPAPAGEHFRSPAQVRTVVEFMPDDNLFLEERHPVSCRVAVLEDDGTSAWLYLTDPGSGKPAADAAGFCFEGTLLQVSGDEFLRRSDDLQTEAFGPAALLVVAADEDQAVQITGAFQGNLTGAEPRVLREGAVPAQEALERAAAAFDR